MSEEDNYQQTPYRFGEDKEPDSTEFKNYEQSHLKEEEEQEPYREREEEPYREREGDSTIKNDKAELEGIQSEIKQIQSRLKDIQNEKVQFNEESEELTALQDQRRVLRKELIDLDFKHRKASYKVKKQNQLTERKIWEEKEREIIAKNPVQKNQKTPEQKREYKNEEGEKKLEENAADARYKARVAQIELELASESLRRSRQVALEAELSSIRSQSPLYLWPSYTDSLYGYYRSPYSRYLSSRYSYLPSIYSPYLYPYPYI